MEKWKIGDVEVAGRQPGVTRDHVRGDQGVLEIEDGHVALRIGAMRAHEDCSLGGLGAGAQTPCWQVLPSLQTEPQAPQLAESLAVSNARLSTETETVATSVRASAVAAHQACGTGNTGAVHTPSLQVSASRHALSHAPQCSGLLERS